MFFSITRKLLGIGKSGDGLDAVRYWKNGEIDKLKKYCLDDIRVTKGVYEHGRDHGHVKVKNKMGQMMDVAVDFAEEKTPAGSVPLTLGF